MPGWQDPASPAGWGGHASVVEALLGAGAKPDTRDENGSAPLHLAALEGHASVVAALLAVGAKPDARTKDGETPLHWAAFEGQTPFDVISPKQKGTDLYWELHDAQYH